MRTYASRTSSGFTLLEVLVVITIVAVLTGVVVFGATGADLAQRQHGTAEALAQRLQLVRQRSLQTNKTWGLLVEPDGYQFAEYDAINQVWAEQVDRPFAPVSIGDLLELRVTVEGEALIPGQQTDEETKQPDVLFFASGEATPFRLDFEDQNRELAWSIRCDGFSAITLHAGDEEL